MGVFVKGEVVVLPFPFSDFKSEKRRPALVISVPRNDSIILCQITKQPTRPEFAIKLAKEDFRQGKLEVDPCYVRADHIFTADPGIVDYSVGFLKPEKLQEVLNETIRLLKDR
jgi:mRNA interferase MazF